MGAGCKPAGVCLRWFESNTLHDDCFQPIDSNKDRGRNSSTVRAFAGVAQLVERQPSKLNVASSNLVSRSKTRVSEPFAHIAQLAERVLGKDEVTSSTLVVGSKISGARGF
jgi:hypothetical protein